MTITINSLLSNVLEYHRLNARYGFLSCLDYPAKYDRMDILQVETQKQSFLFLEGHDVSLTGFITALESIAQDMINGNLSESVKITFYDQEAFICLLASTMTRKEAERFKDMANWMDDKARSSYIETKFILEFENDRNEKRSFYHDERLSFVIVVE